jgi:hypothetical protein
MFETAFHVFIMFTNLSYCNNNYFLQFSNFIKKSNKMKKNILSKLTLGKRTVATLSTDSMAMFNGGTYNASGVPQCSGFSGPNTITCLTCNCPPPRGPR